MMMMQAKIQVRAWACFPLWFLNAVRVPITLVIAPIPPPARRVFARREMR